MTTDPRHIEQARRQRPPLTRRELTVLILSAVVMVLSPLGIGGALLWAIAAGLGFSLAALLAAVSSLPVQRGALILWFFGIVAGLAGATVTGLEILSSHWLDFIAFPSAAFIGTAFGLFMLGGDLRSRPAENCRRDLFRLVPFWAGLALFAYFVVQDFNAWGEVVDRSAFWAQQGVAGIESGKFDIVPLAHVNWLPSGLRAPFITTDTTHPTMNAWRVMLILAGPWAILCALIVGLRRRRGYVILGWIAVGAACLYGIGGFLHQYAEGTILGFPIPDAALCFGPFIYHNHAGVYLYLNVAVALSLTAWHIRRSSHNALRGGPHLVSAFIALYLALFVGLTNSMGATGVVVALGLVAIPATYFIGFSGGRNNFKEIASVTLFALLFAALAFLFTADLRSLGDKLQAKSSQYHRTGADDRAPLRRASWALATDGGWSGRVWSGYGAGSFRWVSPPYQAKQKEQQDASGKLSIRALYAHNDWLQMLAEWGVIGLLPVFAALLWLGRQLVRAFRPGHAESIPLACVLLLLGAHAFIDLIFWFTPLMYAAAFISAAMVAFVAQSSAEGSGKPE
ncbi:MAG: O-antigen ligase family protein [Verrucomicrobiota bacterium]|jgi:O-antigen ligase